MKYQIIIAALVVACLSLSAIAAGRTSDNDVYIAEMQRTIIAEEEVIDSLAELMPFGDTVAEGDNYAMLMEAKNGFENAIEIETMEVFYTQYKKFFFKVHMECIEYIKNRAKQDALNSLPIHVCPN